MIYIIYVDSQSYRKSPEELQKGSYEHTGNISNFLAEIKIAGPIRNRWPNYGKISGKKDCYHCHLQKGKTTYVAVWKVTDKPQKIIEVTYIGTHEKAEYKRLC